jgi:hypothetical protein
MRFMMILIPKEYESAAPDALPSAEAAAKIMELQPEPAEGGRPAGVRWAPPAFDGARISYSDGKATATDGPFAEAKEVIGGYWIIPARSREEAIEWFKRAPIADNDIIEVRQFFEMPDFPEDAQKAAEGFEHRNVVD